MVRAFSVLDSARTSFMRFNSDSMSGLIFFEVFLRGNEGHVGSKIDLDQVLVAKRA